MATELEHEIARYCAWLEAQTGLSLHRASRDEVAKGGLATEPYDDRDDEPSPHWRWWLLAAAAVIGVIALGLFALAASEHDSVEMDIVPDTSTLSTVSVSTEPLEPPSTKVVDGRDGTIPPLAMPPDAVDLVTVAQPGNGRIWVATYTDEDGFGLAFSDDDGATWSHVSVPEGVRATREDPDLAIAADGDRVAVGVWGYDINDTVGDIVYVSDDAGRTWTTATLSDEHVGAVNRVVLYVLDDGRLALVWYVDAFAQQLLVSTRSDWSRLEKVDASFRDPMLEQYTVNGLGIAIILTAAHGPWRR